MFQLTLQNFDKRGPFSSSWFDLLYFFGDNTQIPIWKLLTLFLNLLVQPSQEACLLPYLVSL